MTSKTINMSMILIVLERWLIIWGLISMKYIENIVNKILSRRLTHILKLDIIKHQFTMTWTGKNKDTQNLIYGTDTVISVKYTNAIFVFFLSADLLIIKAGHIIQVNIAIIQWSRITDNKFFVIFFYNWFWMTRR